MMKNKNTFFQNDNCCLQSIINWWGEKSFQLWNNSIL